MMSILSKHPYQQFNFLVYFGADKTAGPQAGFQEITKISGLNKATDVTFKRGVVSSRALSEWLDEIRGGKAGARRDVVIKLQNEDHTGCAQTLTLRRARIIKHVSGPFNAKGTDVAMEELTLAYERLEQE
jgi:phage tail-like protein